MSACAVFRSRSLALSGLATTTTSSHVRPGVRISSPIASFKMCLELVPVDILFLAFEKSQQCHIFRFELLEGCQRNYTFRFQGGHVRPLGISENLVIDPGVGELPAQSGDSTVLFVSGNRGVLRVSHFSPPAWPRGTAGAIGRRVGLPGYGLNARAKLQEYV